MDAGKGEDGSSEVRLRDEVEDVMMKQARTHKNKWHARVYVREYTPGEAITTVGFRAQCIYVESAAVSSYQCSWTAFSLGIYSLSLFL